MSDAARDKIAEAVRMEISEQSDNPTGKLEMCSAGGERVCVEGIIHLGGVSRAVLAVLPDIIAGLDEVTS